MEINSSIYREVMLMIKNYKPIQYRHELKHIINPLEAEILNRRLNLLFSKDHYTLNEGYYDVHSLYFDTPDDRALKEKLNGVSQRHKFRIRYYNHDLSFIRLEKKMKHNGLCAKRSTKLTVKQVQDILNGEIDFLLRSGDPLMIEFYSALKGELLKPCVIVSYQRQAYTYDVSKVRLTIDRYLCTYKNIYDFLSLDHRKIGVDDFAVFEVKYNEFLPDIVKMAIQGLSQKTSAYSKFAKCRQIDW